MAGTPLYPDEEIKFVLKRQVKRQKDARIRSKFQEKFGRALRKNQTRYIKNKYGKDPRFNTAFINGLPKRIDKDNERRARKRAHRKSHKHDTVSDLANATNSDSKGEEKAGKKRKKDEKSSARKSKSKKNDKASAGTNEEEANKEKARDSKLEDNILPELGSGAYQNIIDPAKPLAVEPPLGVPSLATAPAWSGESVTSPCQTDVLNIFSPSLSLMPEPFINNANTAAGYRQAGNIPSQMGTVTTGGWGIANSPPPSMFSQGFMLPQSQHFGQQCFQQNPSGTNQLLSNYPLPMSPNAILPYTSTDDLNSFPVPDLSQQRVAGLGHHLPSQHANLSSNGIFNTNMSMNQNPFLTSSRHQNLLASQGPAIPIPPNQLENMQSVQSAMDQLPSSFLLSQNFQQQKPTLEKAAGLNVESMEDTTAWIEQQLASMPISTVPPVPVSGPGAEDWESVLNPALYEPLTPPAPEKFLQHSPVLTKPVSLDSLVARDPGILHTPQSFCLAQEQQSDANAATYSSIVDPVVVTSPGWCFQPWAGDSVFGQAFDGIEDLMDEDQVEKAVDKVPPPLHIQPPITTDFTLCPDEHDDLGISNNLRLLPSPRGSQSQCTPVYPITPKDDADN